MGFVDGIRGRSLLPEAQKPSPGTVFCLMVVCDRLVEAGALTPQPSRSADLVGEVSGCRYSFGDDFGHRAMFPESPTFSSWDISGGRRDLGPRPHPPGAGSPPLQEINIRQLVRSEKAKLAA